MFKVGDRVVISDDFTIHYSPSNPYGAVGVVIEDDRVGGFKYRVDWLNGQTNVYLEGWLEPYKEVKLTDFI